MLGLFLIQLATGFSQKEFLKAAKQLTLPEIELPELYCRNTNKFFFFRSLWTQPQTQHVARHFLGTLGRFVAEVQTSVPSRKILH